ncbi:S1 family peptidase [Gigaspora margarita]|uniref:S1 family peptidase n=1 Tax=Gigaspora margarita TaxID=4874 RepID=A0A8H4EHT4_GIGMA|nr:S1 family peptidase [Gigaspora margarita]
MLSNYSIVHSQEGSKEPLARLWNIDDDEIHEYLNIERKLIMVDGILRPLLDNDNFSGTRIDVIHNKIFINTLNFARADEIKNLTQINQYIDLLEFEEAFYSTTKLKSNLGGILKLADVYNAAAIGYIDVEFNNIVITSCLGDIYRNNGFLTAIKIYKPDPLLSFYDCGAGISNTSSNDMEPKVVAKQVVKEILAGDGIYSPSEINGSIGFTGCSAGFWARNQANINYIATSGHCFVDSDLFYLRSQMDPSDLIGQMIYHLQSPDFGLIYLDLENVRPIPCIRNRNSRQFPELIINDQIAVSSIGGHLCHSGLTTNVECGYVKSLNRDGFFRNPTYFSDDILIADAWSRGGDSGGPVFYYKDLMNVSLNGILATGISDQISGIFVAVPLSSILNTIDINVVTA